MRLISAVSSACSTYNSTVTVLWLIILQQHMFLRGCSWDKRWAHGCVIAVSSWHELSSGPPAACTLTHEPPPASSTPSWAKSKGQW